MHVCMYCMYCILRFGQIGPRKRASSTVDGRRLTAEDEDDNATCIPHTAYRIPHTTSSERHPFPFPFPFRSRTGRVGTKRTENREQSRGETHASAFRGCPPGPHSVRYQVQVKGKRSTVHGPRSRRIEVVSFVLHIKNQQDGSYS